MGCSALVFAIILVGCATVGGDDAPSPPETAETSYIEGVVTDASDTPVRGCRIELAGAEMVIERTVETDQNGEFSWPQPLVAASYKITVSCGSSASAQGNVVVNIDTPLKEPVSIRIS